MRKNKEITYIKNGMKNEDNNIMHKCNNRDIPKVKKTKKRSLKLDSEAGIVKKMKLSQIIDRYMQKTSKDKNIIMETVINKDISNIKNISKNGDNNIEDEIKIEDLPNVRTSPKKQSEADDNMHGIFKNEDTSNMTNGDKHTKYSRLISKDKASDVKDESETEKNDNINRENENRNVSNVDTTLSEELDVKDIMTEEIETVLKDQDCDNKNILKNKKTKTVICKNKNVKSMTIVLKNKNNIKYVKYVKNKAFNIKRIPKSKDNCRETNSKDDKISDIKTIPRNKQFELSSKELSKKEVNTSEVDDGNLLKTFRNKNTDNTDFIKIEGMSNESDDDDDKDIRMDTKCYSEATYLAQKMALKEKLSYSDSTKLLNLHIQLRHTVLPQHEIETRAGSHMPTREQIENFEKITTLKKGSYSPEEDEIIVGNWKHFCKIHEWDITQLKPFLQLRIGSITHMRNSKERRKFVQFLADGLPNRTLYSVYHRFRNLYEGNVQKRYKPSEDAMILDHLEHNPYLDEKRKYADLAKVLRRTRNSIWRRYRILKRKNNEDNDT